MTICTGLFSAGIDGWPYHSITITLLLLELQEPLAPQWLCDCWNVEERELSGGSFMEVAFSLPT